MEKLVEKYQKKYRISSIRLKKWDYRWSGAYYITICTKNRTCYFGHIENGKMKLSNIGIVADTILKETENHSKNMKLGPHVIMPNHIHVIIEIEKPNSKILGNEYRDIHNKWDNRNNHDDRRDKACLVSTTIMTHQWFMNHKTYRKNQTNSEKSIGRQRFQNQGANSMSSIVGSYKSAVSKNVHRLGYIFEWQSRFYDRIIRDDKSYEMISRYINDNPKNWMKDRFRYSP